MKCVIFFDPLFRAITSPVLHSQIFMHMKMLAELGVDCYFFGADRPESITEEKMEELRERYLMKGIFVAPVRDLGRSRRQYTPALKAAGLCLRGFLKKIRPDYSFVWHIPSWEYLERMSPELRGTLVFQCQGALSHEVRDKGGGRAYLKSLYLRYQEKRCFLNTDVLVSVSHQMSRWMQNTVGRQADFVIPCCYDPLYFHYSSEHRRLKRELLGWEQDVPVIVYSGGTSHWQRIPDMVKLLSKVQCVLTELHILFLSKDVKALNSLVASSCLKSSQVEILNVPHSSVGEWLSAADIGLILRHDSILNNVSSPIKIAEYLASGLGIIATSGIGDYSKMIEQENAGIVVGKELFGKDVDRVVNYIKGILSGRNVREKSMRIANEFSWEFAKKDLIKLYDLLPLASKQNSVND